MEYLSVLANIVAGLMVGGELAIAAYVQITSGEVRLLWHQSSRVPAWMAKSVVPCAGVLCPHRSFRFSDGGNRE
jgi:hypothetical protein